MQLIQLFLNTLIAITVAYAVIIRPIEKLSSRHPKKDIPDYWFDVRFAFFIFAASFLIISPFFFWVKSFFGVSPALFASHLQAMPLWIQLIIQLVLWEFLYYGFHRGFLHSRKFWPLHISHHSPEQLHALAGCRSHIFSTVLNHAISLSVTSFIFGFSPEVAVISGIMFISFTSFVHLDTRLRFGFLEKVIISPHFHVWHHAPNVSKNYAGIFPAIDMLFGTYYAPDHAPEELGPGEEQLQRTVWYHQIQPFLAWKRSGRDAASGSK